MSIKWYGDGVRAKIDKEVDKRIKRACVTIADHAREGAAREQPTAGTGTRKRGLDPSKPGEYPKKVTGHGRRSIKWEYDPFSQVGRVGVGKEAEYMKWLELGTRRIARRPWLSRAVAETLAKVRNIFRGKT